GPAPRPPRLLAVDDRSGSWGWAPQGGLRGPVSAPSPPRSPAGLPPRAPAAALVALWLSLSVSGWLLKKSLDGAAAATGVKLFSTAGLLYLIGALLVVTLIGAPIIVAATVLALAAFLSMPMEVERAEESGPRAEP
ncbi:MAG: DUF996 domain-containing protein, partial [Fervidicoccaceae archaeon]